MLKNLSFGFRVEFLSFVLILSFFFGFSLSSLIPPMIFLSFVAHFLFIELVTVDGEFGSCKMCVRYYKLISCIFLSFERKFSSVAQHHAHKMTSIHMQSKQRSKLLFSSVLLFIFSWFSKEKSARTASKVKAIGIGKKRQKTVLSYHKSHKVSLLQRKMLLCVSANQM